jgi:hypothetical protein
MNNRTVDHGARARGRWDNGNGKAGQEDNGTLGFRETGTEEQRINGTLDDATISVIIVSIVIVITTIVSIHHPSSKPHRRPSSLITQNANANMKTHSPAVGFLQ